MNVDRMPLDFYYENKPLEAVLSNAFKNAFTIEFFLADATFAVVKDLDVKELKKCATISRNWAVIAKHMIVLKKLELFRDSGAESYDITDDEKKKAFDNLPINTDLSKNDIVYIPPGGFFGGLSKLTEILRIAAEKF